MCETESVLVAAAQGYLVCYRTRCSTPKWDTWSVIELGDDFVDRPCVQLLNVIPGLLSNSTMIL